MKRHTFTLLILILSFLALMILWITPITDSRIVQGESQGDASLFQSAPMMGVLFEKRDDNEFAMNYILNSDGANLQQNAMFVPQNTFYYQDAVINTPILKRPKNAFTGKIVSNDKYTLFMNHFTPYAFVDGDENLQLDYNLMNNETKEFKPFTYKFKQKHINQYGLNAVMKDSNARIFFEIYEKQTHEDGYTYQQATDKMLALDIDLNTGKVIQEKEMTVPKERTGMLHFLHNNNYNPKFIVNHVMDYSKSSGENSEGLIEENSEFERWTKVYPSFEIYDSELKNLQTILNDGENESIDQMMVIGDRVFAIVISLEMNQQNLPSYVSIQEVDVDSGNLTEIKRFDDAQPIYIKNGHIAIGKKPSANQSNIQLFDPVKKEIAYQTSFKAEGSEDLIFNVIGMQ